jgi:hypothetical protein
MWYSSTTTNGNQKYYRKYNGKYLCFVLTKHNHLFITFGNKPVTDTDIHFTTVEQTQKEIEAFINDYIEPEIKNFKPVKPQQPKKVWVKLEKKEPEKFGDNYKGI